MTWTAGIAMGIMALAMALLLMGSEDAAERREHLRFVLEFWFLLTVAGVALWLVG